MHTTDSKLRGKSGCINGWTTASRGRRNLQILGDSNKYVGNFFPKQDISVRGLVSLKTFSKSYGPFLVAFCGCTVFAM